jgi:hypothetical protein
LYNGLKTDWFFTLTTPQAFRSFRLVFTVLVANTIYTLPNLYFGQSIPFVTGFSTAATFQQLQASEYETSAAGGLITKKPALFGRTMVLPYTGMSGTERDALAAAERANTGDAWLVIGQPQGSAAEMLEQTFVGRPVSGLQYARAGSTAFYQSSMTIREI